MHSIARLNSLEKNLSRTEIFGPCPSKKKNLASLSKKNFQIFSKKYKYFQV
jgi:hypothetical protein